MTLPTRLRALAGIVEGDLVEAVYDRGARLAKADDDIKAGRLSPVFTSHKALTAHLRQAEKKAAPHKTRRG